MENKLENIKNIFERKNSINSKLLKSTPIKKNEPEVDDISKINMRPRKSYIHDIVKIYEEKVIECIKILI